MKMMFVQVNEIKNSLYVLLICLNKFKLHYSLLRFERVIRNIKVNIRRSFFVIYIECV